MPITQYANSVIAIGTRVSLRPRSAPLEATWIPSENWNRPASMISCDASAITCGSCVYSVAMKCGRPSIRPAENSCVTSVRPIPQKPA